MTGWCGGVQHGTVVNLLIPRPSAADEPPPPGLGLVIIEFVETEAAVKARNAMNGRRFAGRTVAATFVTEEDYTAGNFN